MPQLNTVIAEAAFYLPCPDVVRVNLLGKLPAWVSAKDVILELLRRLKVKGGIGKVMEYVGPALQHLTVYERETICNMTQELGATSGLFPSDELTRRFLRQQKRETDWKPLSPVGVKAILAKSYARIHESNLVNFGIVPLRFTNPADYDSIEAGDELEIVDIRVAVASGRPVAVRNRTKRVEYELAPRISQRQVEMLLDGGLTNYLKKKWSTQAA